MGIRTSVTAAPWNFWKSTGPKQSSVLPTYEEDLDERRPILHLDITSPLSLSEPTPTQLYGATRIGEASSINCSPGVPRNSLLMVLEEDASTVDDEDDEEEELEKHGFFRGSYRRIVAIYTLVPLTSAVVFILLASLQVLAYPPQVPDTYPYPKNFPFPLPELLTSASLWSLSHLLRIPLHSTFFALSPSPTLAILLSTFFHVILHNFLRLSAFPLLLLQHHMVLARPTWHDPSFRRAWWIALGWGLAEVVVGITQGYDQISLYHDVLVPEGKDEEFFHQWQQDIGRSSPPYMLPMNGAGGELTSSSLGARNEAKGKYPELPVQTDQNPILTRDNGDSTLREPMPFIYRGPPQVQVDRDLDQLMALRGREEVEEVYGIPAIRIPVFISCLLRLNSIILSLGITLLVSASYLGSRISHSFTFTSTRHSSTNGPFLVTFPIIIMVHLFLAFLHTPLVLPRIGVHTSAYIGLLVGLGCFFAGLGMWEALS